MGIACYLDPLGSANQEPYKKGQVLFENANPQAIVSYEIDIPTRGVYQIWLVGGGNNKRFCYYECNSAASAAGFIGKLYFYHKCHIKITVGAMCQNSKLEVAVWGDKSRWYGLITAGANTNTSNDPRYTPGQISVNRNSTFNNYFDIELEANGNNGGQYYGSSVWNGYGSGGTNGYGKVQYIRSHQ